MATRTTATLIVMGVAAGAALWATNRDRAVEPVIEEAPSVKAPDAAKETILRARCLLPEGVHATKVSAWFRANPDKVELNYPASIKGEIVTVHVPFGRGQLAIHVEGCVTETRMVDAPDDCTTDIEPFEFRRAYPLRGRIVDERGAPVTNAFVYPKVGDLSMPLQGTHGDGRFSFDGLPEGEATLRVECETMVRRIVKYAHTAGADPLEIVLSDGVRLLGLVLDENGEPIDAVYASVVDTAAPEDRSRMAFPSIANDGTFHIRLGPGRYRVRANHDGRAAIETVDVIAGQDTLVTLRFAKK